MRPLRLVLQAFGPYAGREVVELDRLPADALFLVHGATGSGKTSVLDGICYALYGDTSGAEREGAEMRSDLAAPELQTEVQLDFGVGQDRYRIVRRPQQERPKKRGDGTTVQKPEATLWSLGNSDAPTAPTVVADGERDTVAAIRRRLGFDSAQFRQVVVLPQGRFRELLSAPSSEREKILEALFRTSHYASIQGSLKAKARRLADDLKTMRAAREELSTQLADDLALAEDAPRTTHAFAAALQGLSETCDVERGAEEQARETLEKARADLELGRAAKQKLDALAGATAHHHALLERQPRMQEARKTLEEARRALPLLELEARGKQLAAYHGDAVRRFESAAKQLHDCRTSLESAMGAAATHDTDAAKKQGQELAARIVRLEDLGPRAKALTTARAEEAVAAKALERTNAAVSGKDEEAKEAAQRLDRAREAWDGAHAARLAATLEDGEPCPVCGSRDHPTPAHTVDPALEDSELRSLQRRSRDAALASTKARDQNAQALAAHQAAQVRVTGLAEDLPPELEAPESLLGELEKARGAAATLEQAVQGARKLVQSAREEHARAEAAHKAAETDVQKRLEEVAAAREAFSARLAQAGFESAEAYLAARRSAEEVDQIDATIRKFESDLAGAKNAAETATAAAEGMARPDLEKLEVTHENLAAAARKASTELGALQERSRRAAARLADLRKRDAATAKLEEAFGVFGRLAALATGDNARNLSFQRFVLGALLDEVLEVASRRFLDMSRGRYRVVRRSDPKDRRRAAGLELDVEDGWTGHVRPASTLSGGEGFQAALALALGLADVVQRYAGGTRLDALFIDEGFGSLDPDALDQALSTLLTLREGGRQVGIISHVPELRDRIDVRLEIVGGPEGSTTRVVLP